MQERHAIGQHILTVVRIPEFLNVLAAAIRDNEQHRIRIELNARQLEVQASPLEAAGWSGAIAVLRDITELERLERVRRDFITNISHELRTPLAAIQGYAETLLEGDIPKEAPERGFLETIHRHATRLSRVAADLATLSEIENPSSSGPLEPVSIRMVVRLRRSSHRTGGGSASRHAHRGRRSGRRGIWPTLASRTGAGKPPRQCRPLQSLRRRDPRGESSNG